MNLACGFIAVVAIFSFLVCPGVVAIISLLHDDFAVEKDFCSHLSRTGKSNFLARKLTGVSRYVISLCLSRSSTFPPIPENIKEIITLEKVSSSFIIIHHHS